MVAIPVPKLLILVLYRPRLTTLSKFVICAGSGHVMLFWLRLSVVRYDRSPIVKTSDHDRLLPLPTGILCG